ncbi:dihydroorotate oxidase [Microbulbifer bruguierae]|uniref:dihydroorotate oxidase (fumarate) n=1 Tax=Microbulbifer bruguierae TaxID=3029061 RepID=A0ABY8N8C9_9GAMM|nr:dihydroorotate oxidase [Microbulbifer bruguierae]WGL15043.1 dihydroorotate oxidase [Microbulbifer bruguierae]
MTYETSLATVVAGCPLSSCLYNASGPLCTTAAELDAVGSSEAGAILSKSATLEKRQGNPSPRYFETTWGSINSMGLPNEGYRYYLDYAKRAATFNKPYFISVSGLGFEDNVAIIRALSGQEHVSAIELNLSCPNVPGKPQTGYDFEQSRVLLEMIFEHVTTPLGVKLPPYFDLPHFEMMAAVLRDFPIAFVTCINSIGNGLVIDTDQESVVIKPKSGFGGIGGDFIKPTALANVRKFYTLLDKDVAIIGCGGIKSGMDVFEHILCGASAVQVGTQLMREGVGCFARIAAELREIMGGKGYRDIDSFKGKLKTLE